MAAAPKGEGVAERNANDAVSVQMGKWEREKAEGKKRRKERSRTTLGRCLFFFVFFCCFFFGSGKGRGWGEREKRGRHVSPTQWIEGCGCWGKPAARVKILGMGGGGKLSWGMGWGGGGRGGFPKNKPGDKRREKERERKKQFSVCGGRGVGRGGGVRERTVWLFFRGDWGWDDGRGRTTGKTKVWECG